MAADLVAVENRLWAAADQLWANTGLRPADFSEPVLGLIFLRYADKRFTEAHAVLLKKALTWMILIRVDTNGVKSSKHAPRSCRR